MSNTPAIIEAAIIIAVIVEVALEISVWYSLVKET
jgi:hypothetical protein